MEDVVEYTVENNKLIQWCHGDAKVIETPAIMYDKEDAKNNHSFEDSER